MCSSDLIALALGTTVLLKMGRRRYLWVPLAPLAWLLAVTMTAGWQKIFSADPRLGFLSAAERYREQIASGGTAEQLSQWQHLLTSQYINAAVTGAFLVLVLGIVLTSARVWWRLLSGRPAPALREDAYVLAAPSQSVS